MRSEYKAQPSENALKGDKRRSNGTPSISCDVEIWK